MPLPEVASKVVATKAIAPRVAKARVTGLVGLAKAATGLARAATGPISRLTGPLSPRLRPSKMTSRFRSKSRLR